MPTAVSLPMHGYLASLVDAIKHRASAWRADRARRIAIASLLAIQAGLLAYSATRHSPTQLEPALLASGISHLQFGRFELYRVNPPLVRIMAALPVLAVGCETDWSRYYDGPGSRAEFPVGEDFIKANGPASIHLFVYARWACIPFNLIGAYVACRWASELYRSTAAGFVTLTLYVFEPNLLAHGELITPDGACTAFGILAGYAFWRWLKQPTWVRSLFAGVALGLAELSKMSWLILFGAWPLLWLMWRWTEAKQLETREPRVERQKENEGSPSLNTERRIPSNPPPLVQLATICVVAIYIINMGYLFDGFGTRLREFQFVSTSLTGLDKSGIPGNRFRDSWRGDLPVPLPMQYVLGFDRQKKDLEDFGQKSYLCGEWRDGGWWYYYLYGLLVKVPCGTLVLIVLVVLTRILGHKGGAPLRDELVLLAPAVVLLLVVSSQTEFNIHMRYVFPALGMLLIFLGQAAVFSLARRFSFVNVISSSLIGYSAVSALLVYPHHLAYFNEFVGGPKNGHQHLLGSSVDWGQDFLYLRDWCNNKQPPERCFLVYGSGLDYSGFGFPIDPAPVVYSSSQMPAGIYAITANALLSHGSRYDSVKQRIRLMAPTESVGVFSIYISD